MASARLENGRLMLSDDGQQVVINADDRLALERLAQIVSQARAWAKRSLGDSSAWPKFFSAPRKRGKAPWETSWGSALLNGAIAQLVASGELEQARALASQPDVIDWPAARITGAEAEAFINRLVAAVEQNAVGKGE